MKQKKQKHRGKEKSKKALVQLGMVCVAVLHLAGRCIYPQRTYTTLSSVLDEASPEVIWPIHIN
jgi:hypothetical protein